MKYKIDIMSQHVLQTYLPVLAFVRVEPDEVLLVRVHDGGITTGTFCSSKL
jgi:hypothetical protein